MGISGKKIIKAIFKKGFRIGWSTGPMFDPTDQIRTDAVQDIVKSKTNKEGEKWDGKIGH